MGRVCRLKRGLFLGFIFLTGLACIYSTASATSSDVFFEEGSNLSVRFEEKPYAPPEPGPDCSEPITVVGQNSYYDWVTDTYSTSDLQRDVCVTRGATLEVTSSLATESYGIYKQALRFKGETKFHFFEFPEAYYVGFMPELKGFIIVDKSNPQKNYPGGTFWIVDDITGSVSAKTTNDDGEVSLYTLDFTKSRPILWPPDAYDRHFVNGFKLTPDGQYLIVHTNNRNLIKIDVRNRTSEKIGEAKPTTSFQTPGGVSRDGRYIAMRETKGAISIVDSSKCSEGDGSQNDDQVIVSPCKVITIDNVIQQKYGKEFMVYDAEFLDDSTVAVQIYSTMPGYLQKIRAVISNFDRKLGPITYIALGDSYTSGEGDIGRRADGTSYYTIDTDGPNGCHLSARSYPFLLKDKWKIGSDDMHSIACSGAVVRKDYASDLTTYEGQHHDLNNFGKEGRESLIDSALQHYIPGMVPQAEFVKKYKPDIITLTGGGNDVGFADILSYCAGDTVSLVWEYSCEYTKGGVLEQVLNDTIDSQFGEMVKLIQTLQQASPSSKIYYVGYPSFIAGSNSFCALNSGLLDGKEQDMINDAVHRLNGVIQAAAAKTRVSYVHIEDVLNGGRLCEGSEYMTGVWDNNLFNSDRQQTFHPNAKGHGLIANKISQQVADPLKSFVPEAPHVVSIDPLTPTYRAQIVQDSDIAEGDVLRVRLEPSSVKQSSDLIVSVFSKPVTLGSIKASSDGSAYVDFKLPNSITAGRHLVTVDGITPDNSPLRLFQYITVKKSTAAPTAIENDPPKVRRETNSVKAICIEGLTDTCEGVDKTRIAVSFLAKGDSTLVDDAIIPAISKNSDASHALQRQKNIKSVSVASSVDEEYFTLTLLLSGILLMMMVLIVWKRTHVKRSYK